MNSFKYLLVSLSLLLMVACGDTDTSNSTPTATNPVANSPIIPPADANTPITPPETAAEPPQNAAGVWHYTCPNGHPGGAGEGLPCATCGTTLVHNSVYHETGDGAVDPATAAESPTTISPDEPAAATAEPPQNAAGVWHYTCANGCAGGGGSATACASCGSTLEHNQAYHGNASTTPATPGAPAPVASTPGGTPMTMFADPTQQPVNATMGAAPIQPAALAEPAQNDAGVWHYTCSNGCEGGGGSATPCATCGTLLVHNQSYH